MSAVPPPPPPSPPNILRVTYGLDFFGIVGRQCDRENAQREAEYKRELAAYSDRIKQIEIDKLKARVAALEGITP